MKKTASKWPSRAINLLVALSMVISLVLLLAPAVAAQVVCDPVEPFDGCNLEVFVSTYTKDINGDFTPVYEVAAGTQLNPNCFYVNAVVVNTGNVTADGISATISLGNGTALAAGESATKTWDTDANWQALDPTIPGRMAEFWWKVCCIDDNGYNTITVTANAATGGCSEAVGQAYIIQTPPPSEECLYIEIIEAPGWAAPGYTMTFPNALVTPCTNFGIKALVRNDCDHMLSAVPVTINVTGTGTEPGTASIVGGDPATWQLGDLYPEEERVVAWTLHCDGEGDVEIEVDSTYAVDKGDHNPWDVEQFGAGDLTVEITSPDDGYEVCAGCAPANQFPIEVTVYNNTGETVSNITVQLTGNDTAAFTRTPSFLGITSLAHGSHAHVTFNGTCTAFGDVLLTANAGGQGTSQYWDAVAPDTIVVEQKQVTARILDPEPGDDYDAVANICKTFQIISEYQNCSGIQLSNVEMTIFWRGNATLILTGADRPMFYKIPTGTAWEYFSSLNTVIVDYAEGWHSNTQTAIICQCCSTQIKWNFNCTGDTDVESYATVEWTGIVPPSVTSVTYTDDSEEIQIWQLWKAHLIVSNAPFLQDEDGLMWNRNAFAPGQNFHVVIPIANVGDERAQNVQVTFRILSDPADWNFVSISGDATGSWNETTATGIATIPWINGNTVKKIIVQLECAGEGQVQFNIQSVVGTHYGTGDPIEASNIERPPCPLDLYQVPFDVTIVNPFYCDTYNPGDVFGVKAVITNDSSTDLGNVSATIHWEGNVALHGTQTATKLLGNVTAGSVHEITWEMRCTNPGEVLLWVTAGTTIPFYITAESDTVNVHQRDCMDVGTMILSPDPEPTYADDMKGTAIATGEEFAVTALVRVNGTEGQQAEDVQACIYFDSTMLELAVGSACIQLGDMYTGTMTTVTWTLQALATGDYECWIGGAEISVNVTTSSRACNPNDDSDTTSVTIYPAAQLVAEIVSITPASPFVKCEEFEVTYRIWNTGEADAWDVSATLSVNPDGNIRIAEGEGGYTQYLGTVPGWSYYSGGYSYVEDTFMLHAKEICESTITITPDGNDECGWHTVFVQDEDHWQGEYQWYNMPGRDIDAEFINPVSQTVKVVESKQITGDMTTFDINLASGWNLISLPLIPTSTAIGTVLADVDENTTIVWSYDAVAEAWTSWEPGFGGDLTAMVDGKGYWIYMDAADLLTVNGVELKPAPNTPPSYAVTPGWNLIGFKSSVQRTAGDYLLGIAGSWTRIYTYGTMKYSAVGSSDMMNPGKGYWIAVTTAGTIYP